MALGRVLAAITAIGVVLGQQAAAQIDRNVLPVLPPESSAVIRELATESVPEKPFSITAPAGAPNILVVMSDDVGFAMSSAFGGPVPTPSFDRLSQNGKRYNRFHTTGICSPSRAALLTGRNHHNTGNGYLSELSTGYPGYRGYIGKSTATLARILRYNGYSTAMWGKHHNVPSSEKTAAGPFDNWPTGLGFDYFHGFIGGDVDQFEPILYRGTDRVDSDPNAGAMVEKRMADDMIRWLHNQKAAAPDTPFFAYYAPGSAHAPHQAPQDYIDRFRGKFDQGWDKLRETIFARQLQQGIVPRGTKLTPRPDAIPSWNSLSPTEKRFASRTMEAAAAQLAYQDEQFGRVLDELQRMKQLDNTLVIVIQGDNGASGEAGPPGTINEYRSMTRHDENAIWMHANIDKLGGPEVYGNYPVGWAWAMGTPFRWVKQYASMLGGVRNGMIMSWSGNVREAGSVCAQFGHLVDVAPTVLAAARLPMPTSVDGIRQKPLDGESLLPSLGKCNPSQPRTQYFEVAGKRALYKDGWFASGEDGRLSWTSIGPGGDNPDINWTLYNLDSDFSQSTDLSSKHPARLQEMVKLWNGEASRNNVFPLDYRFAGSRTPPPPLGRKNFEFWGKDVSLSALGEPFLVGRSFTVKADLILSKPEASGVVLALGSSFGGWSLFLEDGKPVFVFARSTDPKEISRIAGAQPLPQGTTSLTLRFTTAGPEQPAEIELAAAGKVVAKGSVPNSLFMPSGMGETLDVGRDLGVKVTEYKTPQGQIEGDVPYLSVTLD